MPQETRTTAVKRVVSKFDDPVTSAAMKATPNSGTKTVSIHAKGWKTASIRLSGLIVLIAAAAAPPTMPPMSGNPIATKKTLERSMPHSSSDVS
jgi:hypothetical protein